MKILVTGGLGNLGSWVTRALVEHGHHVTTFSREDRPLLTDLLFERLLGDLRRIEDVSKLNADQQWDGVIHLASADYNLVSDNAKQSLLVNTLGTRNLLEVLCSNSAVTKPHFIYFSTFHVYGRTSGQIDERTTLADPKSDYGSTHLFAEYYVKQFHHSHRIPFTIFRLTNGYGAPLEKGSTKWHLVLNDLCRMAFQNREISLRSNGLAQRDFIWLGDVCDVLERALAAGGANKTFNLGSGTSISMGDLARIVQDTYRERFGTDAPINFNTEDLTQEEEKLVVSIDALKDWIGFTPTDRMREEIGRIFTLLEA